MINKGEANTDPFVVPITGTVTILLFFFLHLHNPKTPVWDGLKAIDVSTRSSISIWFGI
jgi:hypothetical protein